MRYAVLTLLIAFTGFTQAVRAADDLVAVQLAVEARGEPIPALRYRLMPSLAELTPGNAAPVYLSGLLLAPKITNEQKDQLAAWEAMSVEKLPREDVSRFLEPFGSALDQFDVAARREHCRWDMPLRERAFMALLPHLQGIRDMSRVIGLRARLLVAEQKFDDASRALATGFAMARHTGQDGVLIEALVASASARHLGGAVRAWQAAPGAPNLYWGVAEIPRPFIDSASALRRDNVLLYVGVPGLGNARDRKVTVEQWRNIVDQAGAMAQSEDPNTAESVTEAIKQSLDAAVMFPKARAYLLSQGAPQAQVDAMQPLAVVAVYQIEQYERQLQDMQKWFSLPYWQARAGLDETMRRFEQTRQTETNVLFGFVPAMSRAFSGCVAVDRELAAIQIVEAVRAYAGANQGKLPASLDDLADSMPAPIDPMTGTSFDYVPGDTMFTLTAEAIDGRNGLKYEVTLK